MIVLCNAQWVEQDADEMMSWQFLGQSVETS
jgi:hypothetical protein